MADEFVNLAAYFLDHNVETRPEKVALRFRDECYTFAEMHRWSCQFGNALRAMGVREEDRVLLAMNDVPAFGAAWFGVTRIGGVIVMINPIVPADDWAYYLRYSRARVLITEQAFAEQHAGVLAGARQLSGVVCVDRARDLEAILAQPEQCPYGDTLVDDPSVWLFSSGSTGRPKACMHVNGDFVYNTERYAKQVLGIREDDVTLSVPKQFFGYATGTNLLFPWAVGATTCFYAERATPDTVLANVERFRPTILTNVPTMIARMLEHPACATTDLSSVRMVLSAGEALPAELYRRWVGRTGVEILDGIGSAEMFHIYITNYPGDVKLGTLGRLVPGYEARIVGGDGREVAPGEIGTLYLKGGSAAIGYHRDRAKSRATFLGDWTNTSDQFRVDEDGRFVYCGRADDLLKVGGVYVSPIEVENCLMTHELVRECAVVGVERDGLTVTCAFVVATGETSEAALQEYVKTRLAPHKYPRMVRFLADLPRNDRGKAARAELRKLV